MPDVDTHCKISKERTLGKNDFKELHEWIDEPQKFLGVNHRIERHSFHEAYRDYISKNFGGEKAVIEWLFHIALDNLETAHKLSVEEYSSPYDIIEVKFKDKEISSCDFIKTHPNSSSVVKFEKEVK